MPCQTAKCTINHVLLFINCQQTSHRTKHASGCNSIDLQAYQLFHYEHENYWILEKEDKGERLNMSENTVPKQRMKTLTDLKFLIKGPQVVI